MPKKVQQTEHPVLDMTMPERKATDMSGFFRDHKLPDQAVTGFSDGALFTGDSIGTISAPKSATLNGRCDG